MPLIKTSDETYKNRHGSVMFITRYSTYLLTVVLTFTKLKNQIELCAYFTPCKSFCLYGKMDVKV